MYSIFHKINNAYLPVDLALKLFDHTVTPILTYGSEIFGFENINMIENVHKEFLRKLTGARKSTPLYMLYRELGRYPLEIIIKTRMVSFWNKLIMGKEHKLSMKIYRYMLNQNINYKWINKIKDILGQCGRNDIWLFQPLLNQTSVNKQIKAILIDQFKQDWYSQLGLSNKSKVYMSFKGNFQLENSFKILPKQDYVYFLDTVLLIIDCPLKRVVMMELLSKIVNVNYVLLTKLDLRNITCLNVHTLLKSDLNV